MNRIFNSILYGTLMLSSNLYGGEKLKFQEFMAAFSRDDLALQSSRERERIWEESDPTKALGWDRAVSAEWRRRDFVQNQDRTDLTAGLVQGSPYGINGTLRYQNHDLYTGTKTESLGVEIDLLRNRFGSETAKQADLLSLRKKILNLESIESGVQACMQGLNSVSRFVLLERQEEIYQNMIAVQQQLKHYVEKRVGQGGLNRVDLLSMDAEIASLNREIQAVRQAKAEWVAIETNRLALAFTGLEFPRSKEFLQFDFIPKQFSAWLPELARLQQQIEESQTQINLLDEQGQGNFKVFGQAIDDLQGQSATRNEIGFSITIPLQDSALMREKALQSLTSQSLRSEKRAAEQKASILLAETEAKVKALEQRLDHGESSKRTNQNLDKLLKDQYQKAAVSLDRLFRQQELKLREELVQEQVLFELRSARSLYVIMQKNSPNFCVGN